MPSGKIHDKIALFTLVPAYIAGQYLFKFDISQNLIFCSFLLLTQLMFGPDLDTESIQFKRWGIFRWLWIPYRLLFTHRSGFSHGLILGPLLRIVYFLIILIILFSGFKYLVDSLLAFDTAYIMIPYINLFKFSLLKKYLWAAIFGILTGAAIHTLTDKIFSFFKNIF